MFAGRSEGKMSEPLQATTLGEAVVAMDPLSRGFPRNEEAFALRHVRRASSAREGRRGNGT